MYCIILYSHLLYQFIWVVYLKTKQHHQKHYLIKTIRDLNKNYFYSITENNQINCLLALSIFLTIFLQYFDYNLFAYREKERERDIKRESVRAKLYYLF